MFAPCWESLDNANGMVEVSIVGPDIEPIEKDVFVHRQFFWLAKRWKSYIVTVRQTKTTGGRVLMTDTIVTHPYTTDRDNWQNKRCPLLFRRRSIDVEELGLIGSLPQCWVPTLTPIRLQLS